MRSDLDLTALPERRPLRLARRVRESAIIDSVWLEPADGLPLWPFVAGQYLTLEVPAGAAQPLLRTYTISSPPQEANGYRLTVKREPPPPAVPSAPAGLGSTFLHDRLAIGDSVVCHRPRGAFTLAESGRPVVMLSGGVGLTPMVAMLADLAARQVPRQVYFFHASRGPDVQALADDVRALAARHGATTVRFFHEEPVGQPGGLVDPSPRIDMAALKRLLPFDDHEFLLCGPAGFMAALYEGLTDLNVDPKRIAYEFFGPATVLRAKAGRDAPSSPAPATTAADGPVVTFAGSRITAIWPPDGASLLELAEKEHVDILHSCRDGVCGTCRTRLLAGEIDYFGEPIAWCEPGEILTCISRPRGNITLAL